MTDRELMQQALEALTMYDGANGESKRKRVLTALRERLAQPEQKLLTEKRIEELYSFWVVDCQDIVGFARAIERSKPQMQPCAGRNCGSTNPNLHSVECFEDYEKSTGMATQPVAWQWKERINGDFDSWVISASEPPPYATEKHPLYTAPPKREWVGLTDEEQQELHDKWQKRMDGWGSFYQAVEAKLKEKNTC